MAQATEAAIVTSERKGDVKWVRLNRPEVRNAIGTDSADLVREELSKAPGEGARVVVLTGSGGSFCAGADLKALAPHVGEFTGVKSILRDHYHPLLKTIVESPLPVVAAVDGAAAGIGHDIALAADIRLASDRAFFSQVFVNIGLMPDGGGTFTLPRLIGLGRALEMALTGRRVQAAEALSWGLVNHVYPAATFESEVARFADELAKKAPLSMARSKRAMRAAFETSDFAQAMLREADLQEELFATDDFREGVMAFIEKRPAKFQGK